MKRKKNAIPKGTKDASLVKHFLKARYESFANCICNRKTLLIAVEMLSMSEGILLKLKLK